MIYPFRLGQYVEDIGGGYYPIILDVTALADSSAVKKGETYHATRFNPRTNKFCIDFHNGFIGWYPEELFTYEGKQVKYMLVLYNLKNGLSRLESIHLDAPPSEELVKMSVELYGAESYDVQEISILSTKNSV